MGLRRQVLGLKERIFKPESTDFGPERANFGLERVDFGPERGLGGMDRRTDGRMYGHLEIHPCVLQDIGPLGPLPKKGDRLNNHNRQAVNQKA